MQFYFRFCHQRRQRFQRPLQAMFPTQIVKGCPGCRKLNTDHGQVHPKISYAPLNLS